MDNKEEEKFLQEPNLIHFATIGKEGFPHVTPLWFKYEDGIFYVSTVAQRQKGKNLERNKKIGFSIVAENDPYKVVVGSGSAEVEDDPEWELIRELAIKYRGEKDGNAYADGLLETEKPSGQKRIVVKIKPQWLRSWSW